VFASYRPAVCLLSLRSNSNESAPLFPNQNKPRPTRQQARATLERFVGHWTFGVYPAPGRGFDAGLRAVTAPPAKPSASAAAARSRALSMQPHYLKPFLSDLPYNHLSPPA